MKRGRPAKEFGDCSLRSKKRKSAEATRGIEQSKLFHALILSLQKEGRTKDAKIIRHILEADKDGTCTIKPKSTAYSPDEALALLLDCGLSKADYQTLHQGAKEKGCNIYPAYNEIRHSKDKCCPQSGIQTTDYSASVELQGLLDHTAGHIYKAIDQDHVAAPGSTLILTSKVGFDGSTGQSVYKQGTEDEERLTVAAEESLFLSCMVPIQLQVQETKEILWINNKTSSTHYTRPVHFKYVKENKEVVQAEYDYFKKSEISL